MSFKTPSCFIGVDGGGSGCRAVLRTDQTAASIVETGGPTNVTGDLETALANLADLLARLVAKAGLTRPALSSARVHLALAGLSDDSLAATLGHRLGLENLTASSDQRSTVVGAIGLADGAVAGVGTGSFLAFQQAGQTRFSGGRGPVIGDHASGAWLGRLALEQTLLAYDGVLGPTALTRDLMARLGPAPSGLVRFARDARQPDFASLAPMVVAHADNGDSIGEDLMQRGAAYLTAALAALGWHPGVRLCLTGGLGPSYAAFLLPEVQSGLVTPIGTALDGALLMAMKPPEPLHQRGSAPFFFG